MSESEVHSKKVESVDNVTVSSGVLADLFSLTDRRVRQLSEEGILVKVKRGRYSLAESVKNYIIHIKTNNDVQHSKNDTELDLEKEKAIHEKIKREIAELKLSAMRGDMHHSDDVERVMNDMLASFRAKVLSMASKLAPILIARDNIGSIQEIIKKECLEVLEELSNYDPAAFYGSDYIDNYDDEVNSEGDNNGTQEKGSKKDKE